MTLNQIKPFFVLAVVGLFSQFAVAQSDADSAAMQQIATLVTTLNHFPSDDDLTTLDTIIANSELSAEVHLMADTVANIEHSANDAGKVHMQAIAGDANASDQARGLAEVIANLNHMVSDTAKAQLAKLFP